MRYTISSAMASLLLALPTLAAAEVPRVVTDIPPVQSLVAQVMGDLGTPELLLAKGADEHDFQLRPSQMGAISGAGLVVWIGPELTPWLDRALRSAGGGVPQLALLDAAGTAVLPYGEGAEDEHGHEEGEDHGGDDHGADAQGADDGQDHGPATEDEAEGDHDHHHGATDPHAWLDPGNAETWLGLIAAELSRLDPDHAAIYAANAAAARTRITALDAEVAALLAPVKDKPFITFHAAYGYLTHHYGLEAAGSVALGDAATPGAARLQALRDRLAGGGVLCAFPEIQHNPKLLAQVMEGSGTRLGGALDPVGSGLEPGPAAYDTLLRAIATTLGDCLKG